QKGDTGGNGWTPVWAVVGDGERRVLRIDDWTGGTGTKPATGDLGPTGIVASSGDGVDGRGAAGSGRWWWVNEVDPDGAGNVELGVEDIPGLAAALSDTVKTSGDQTVGGQKTFSSAVWLDGGDIAYQRPAVGSTAWARGFFWWSRPTDPDPS